MTAKKLSITCWSADRQLSEAAALHQGENEGCFAGARAPRDEHTSGSQELLPRMYIKGTIFMAWDWNKFFFIILKLKGTVPRLHIFSGISFPPTPEHPISSVSNFFDDNGKNLQSQSGVVDTGGKFAAVYS